MLSLKRIQSGWEKVWEVFAPFHYFSKEERSPVNKAAYKFLVYDDATIIGFACSLPMPSGSLKNAWKSHKIVVLPDYAARWSEVADFVAQFHTTAGKRWFCQAPKEFAEYRDSSPLWRPTRANDPPRKYSHEYIGKTGEEKL